MRVILAILFYAVLSASAQIPPNVMQELILASIPKETALSSFSPTNIAGYPAYGWYVVDGNFSSVSGLAQLTNLTQTAGISLTNMVAGTGQQPTLVDNVLNGKDVLYFDGSDDYLRSVNATSAQPNELFMVVALTNAGSFPVIYSSALNSPLQRAYYAAPQVTMSSPTLLAGIPRMPTNKWMVLNFVINGASSAAYTNGVASANGDVGGNMLAGLTVMARYDGAANRANTLLAEVITYNTNLGAIDSAGTFNSSSPRLAVFSYLTNKYNITP